MTFLKNKFVGWDTQVKVLMPDFNETVFLKDFPLCIYGNK